MYTSEQLQTHAVKSVTDAWEFSNVNVGRILLESVDFFQAYEIYCSKQGNMSRKSKVLQNLNSFILAPAQRSMK
ncbi:hypothetical protein pdam_00009192 [Pocillopora damicornis]|uniref:Uncharacterized protein n=1 Tax=Pocillopora damicornis TaxID=46731 RepID=A0A3M6TTY1_POCDA|nr:hypothetical protein pdam_00009192 [Pocillopora damicornis]